MLLQATNICKEYGIQKLFDISKLEIKDGDRIGLVGRNGAGKTTLLKVLTGEVKADEGSVKRNCEIACIRQTGEWDENEYGQDDMTYLSRMQVNKGDIISGGERMRMAIATAFSKHCPLLFADEPTTNLDIAGTYELEKMLQGYRGAVVMISHDRQLLDYICNQIWELEDGGIRIFPGSYSDWCEQKKREREFEQFEYEQYSREKRRLEKTMADVKQEAKKVSKPPRKMGHSEWMLYKGTASIQQGHVQNRSKAIESRLNHLEVKERPKELPHVTMRFGSFSPIKARNAARVTNLTVSFDEHMVLDDISVVIPAGKKTFLTGSNGAGKTTLIDHLLHDREHTFITSEAKVGYFAQGQDDLDENDSVIENVKATSVVPEHICMAILLNLYFTREDLSKKVSHLSGGERVKVAIAKLLVSDCNFLILDEPTNHCDIYTMEALESLLEKYDGTALIISHDRRFKSKLADQVIELKDGQVRNITI